MVSHHNKPHIGISGSYGGLNLGDEAILRGIVSQLRGSLDCTLTVFSHDPEDTLRRHPVDRALPVRRMTREEARNEIRQLDLFILGGGGILFDGEAVAYLREAQVAQEVGIPVVIYAISAGPLEDQNARRLARDTLNRAALVTVRDRRGLQLLEEVGVRNVQVTADPALLLEPEPLPTDALKREGLDEHHRLIGLSVREPGPAAPDMDVDHYHSLVANAADFIIDRLDADVVFVPMERKHMDVQHSHAVVAKMCCPQRATVLKGDYTSGQIVSLMSHLDFAVGMRLHFLIFAALQSVPFIALPYASKVTGFLEELKIETPPLKALSAGQLIAMIDRSWDLRQQTRERIREILPELQGRARSTNTMVLEILGRATTRNGEGGKIHAAASST